jgi:hypothetical protein
MLVIRFAWNPQLVDVRREAPVAEFRDVQARIRLRASSGEGRRKHLCA